MTQNATKLTRIVLIDLDDTLVFNQYKAFSEAREALRLLVELGYTLILFSHNDRAEEVAKHADVFYDVTRNCQSYWSHVVAGCWDLTKQWNLQQVREMYPHVALSEMVLFDDWPQVVQWCRSQGVMAYHVSHQRGLTISDILTAGLVPWHEVFGFGFSHVT